MTASPETPKPLQAWSGEFGDAYTQRSAATAQQVRGRALVWAQVLARMAGDPPKRVLEVGPNVGINLRALRSLLDVELWAIEPNASARQTLLDDGVLAPERLFAGFGHSIPAPDACVDLAFTSGVLIHVDPSLLERTVDEIHRVSAKYVFCAEYFAPRAETIRYRGEEGLLFKNDFGSVYLDRFPDLELVDCGFFWRRTTVMDDTNWWLFRKR
jgi:pseudaminic acid biosynthesis-associated methylase